VKKFGTSRDLGAIKAQGQLAQSFACRREYRIRNSRCDRGYTGLPNAGRCRIAVNDVYVYVGRFGQAQQGVVMEITLHYGAIFKRDLAMQRGRQPKDDTTSDLLPDHIGGYCETAVNGTGDAMHAGISIHD